MGNFWPILIINALNVETDLQFTLLCKSHTKNIVYRLYYCLNIYYTCEMQTSSLLDGDVVSLLLRNFIKATLS